MVWVYWKTLLTRARREAFKAAWGDEFGAAKAWGSPVVAAVVGFVMGGATQSIVTGVVSGGAILLLWPAIFFVTKLVTVPAKMHIEGQATIAQLRAAEANLSGALGAKPVPDWPIGALFYHINPAVTDQDTDVPVWEDVGRDILDKLATDQMVAWGRLDNDLTQKPWRPIRREYWEAAEWTYWFFQDADRGLVHCQARQFYGQMEQYRDVQVNRK